MSDSNDDSDFEYENLSESSAEESSVESEEYDDSSDDDLDLENMWCPINTDRPNPPPPRFPFLGNPNPTFDLEDESDVFEYFRLFIDDSFINIIVTETNRYAEQKPGPSSNPWTPVDKNEIFIFLAINILQGILKKPEEKMYWTTSEIFETPIFPKLMSRRRYLLIKRNLHFSNNEDCRETHPNPKLNKIWPIFSHINSKCSSLYLPERDISIDESLMLYKGRLGWVQYIPLKRARFGVKLYLLCESKSGYLFSAIIYTGKGTLLNEKYKDMPMTAQLVLSLLDPLLDQGYCLTTDNFYTSPLLADYLTEHKTDTYGTVRANRKDMPEKIQKSSLKRGEILAYQKGKLMAMKWQDKKPVTFLSTIHNTEKLETNKKDKDGNTIWKPKIVMDYNNTMGGVDLFDQRIQDYQFIKKRGKKYYKKIFFHLFDICIWNSFVLYNKNGGQKSNLNFRETLIERIIRDFHTGAIVKKTGRPRSHGPLRLIERHFPSTIPAKEKKKTPTRICVVCSNQKDDKGKRKRRESRYYCEPCNVGLCVSPCFMVYHTKMDF